MNEKDDIDILARTIYGEARGEKRAGREAVAAVVMNRVNKKVQAGWVTVGGRKQPSVAATCLKPYQFSCWLESDPNREKIITVSKADALFRECLEIASQAVNGRLPDITRGATHYYNPKVCRAAWAKGKRPCAEIGAHLFFNDID